MDSVDPDVVSLRLVLEFIDAVWELKELGVSIDPVTGPFGAGHTSTQEHRLRLIVVVMRIGVDNISGKDN